MTDDPDEQLVARLREIASAVEAPPEHVDAGARAAFSTRHLDELLEVLMDSAAADVAVRGQARVLSLAAGEVSVDVHLTESPGGWGLRGLVQGPVATLAVESATARRELPVDADGWFVADGLSRGLVRLRLTLLDGRGVATAWIDL